MVIVFPEKTFINAKGRVHNGYYLDGYLKDNLDELKKIVKQNWDGVFMVDGIEGTAKTSLGSAICHYLDPTYSLKNVVFTTEQFFEAVDSAGVGEVVHWDEFVFGGLSTEAFNAMQNALVKKLSTIRKKNLFICLIMPQFYMMRAYFACDRSRFLIHCKTPDGVSRGYFEFYSYKAKQKLYYYCKKNHHYLSSLKNFDGRFTDTFGMFWDHTEYDKKKEEAIENLSKEKGADKRTTEIYLLMKELLDKGVASQESIAQLLGKTQGAVSHFMIKYAKIIDNTSQKHE